MITLFQWDSDISLETRPLVKVLLNEHAYANSDDTDKRVCALVQGLNQRYL